MIAWVSLEGRGCRCLRKEATAVATAARAMVTMKYEGSTGFVLKNNILEPKDHFCFFKAERGVCSAGNKRYALALRSWFLERVGSWNRIEML